MKPTLLVLAAGMGSRYGGVKQIDSVGIHDECLLDYATYDAKHSGFGNVVYIIRKDIEKDFRERLFDRVARNFDASYVFQTREAFLSPKQVLMSSDRGKPWGTIHAVLCAKDAIKAPFAIINSDDYYGRSAIKTMGSYLSSIQCDSTEYAMVGYILGNTMSKNGSVTRGICTVNNGYLEKIVETLKIYYKDNDVVSLVDGKEIMMTGKEWASMNLFGFSPKVFNDFHDYWNKFISENVSSTKAEALLPTVVESIIAEKKGRMKLFTTNESWFGMTYPQDRQIVRDKIAEKINSGYYPERLWEK